MDKLEKTLIEEIDRRIEIINDKEYIFPKRLNMVDWIGLAVIFVICLFVIIFLSISVIY